MSRTAWRSQQTTKNSPRIYTNRDKPTPNPPLSLLTSEEILLKSTEQQDVPNQTCKARRTKNQCTQLDRKIQLKIQSISSHVDFSTQNI